MAAVLPHRSQTRTKQHNHTATSTVTDPGHFHTTENFVVRRTSGDGAIEESGVGSDGKPTARATQLALFTDLGITVSSD